MNPSLKANLKAALLGAGLLLTAWTAPAQGDHAEFIAQHFFPPDLIKRAHAVIGLTDDQAATLKAEVEHTQQQMALHEQQLREATQALLKLVDNDRLDEKAVLDQADKVLALERKAKLTQLTLLIRIKNTLTPEQQKQLRELKTKFPALETKINEVRKLAGERHQQGADVSHLRDLKPRLEELIKAGKLQEANKLLDDALETLR